MDVDAWTVGDRLEILGVAVGLLLVLGGLGSLLGAPWRTNPDAAAVLFRLVGIALSLVVAVVLIWIVRNE